MTKQDLIDSIAAATKLSKKDIDAVLKALPEALAAELKANGSASLPGVVNLKVKDRAARIGRNPSTGAAVEIPAKKVVGAKLIGAVSKAVA